jgi:hypothetical protein
VNIDRGKRWATGAFLVGIAMSIYGNVAHTLVGKSAHFGAILFASFWPVAVFLSIEIMARVDWPDGNWWRLARFGGLGLVAAVAAITSYHHLSALLVWYGEDATVAKLGPLAPDGLMVIAAAALQATTRAEAAVEAADGLAALAEGDGVPEVAEASSEPSSRPGVNGHRPLPRRRQVATRLTQGQRKVQAVEHYRQSVADGQPLSGEELGELYGMSGRWGRDRIAEAKVA